MLKLAEGMGFEPTIRYYPYNGLANRYKSAENSQNTSIPAGNSGSIQEHGGGLVRRTTRHSAASVSAILLPLLFIGWFTVTLTLAADHRRIGNRQWIAGCWCWSNADSRFWPARSDHMGGVICGPTPSLLAWAFTP